MIGILFVSHGKLVEGMMDSLKMFFGEEELKQTACLTLSLSDDAVEFGDRIDEKIRRLDTGDGVVILADMLGGTPCNQSLMKMKENLNIITGVNMPMAMELINQRIGSSVNLASLVLTGKDSVLDAGKMMYEDDQVIDDD
ncbi:MAG: PTS mannose transporter subunit IIA [Erysipelotrichia bacterium]|nr:PTS mannose transporter subunit IIA [Erysipelotrichia bacterium]